MSFFDKLYLHSSACCICYHCSGRDYAPHFPLLDVACPPQSAPELAISTFAEVLPLPDPRASIFLTTSIPLVTFPKTVCFPSNQGVSAVQMKNCDPLVLGPALAMLKVPGPP
mmetsp:Transcript_8455/g.15645  ORF Transcript_8455/g.15645 Transcript_8455/m.15645 type:complete len:112 (+) Transcript_8455:76-411(+)